MLLFRKNKSSSQREKAEFNNINAKEFNRVEHMNSKLKDNLIHFTAMVEHTPAAILLEDINRNIILTNRLFCEIFSIPYKPDEIIGSDHTMLIEKYKHLLADPEKFSAQINKMLSCRKTLIAAEVAFLDGRVFELNYIPVFDEDLTLSGHIWQYYDASDRKETEKKIINHNKLLAALFKNSTDAIAYFDQYHRIIDINQNFQDLFGYGLHEIAGIDVDDVLEQGKKDSANRDYTRKVLSGQNIITEGTRYTRHGGRIEVLIKGVPVFINNQFCGGYAIYNDITDRKEAVKKLQERERQLNNLLGNLPGMVYRCRNDRNWTMEFISSGCLKITGYRPEDLVANKLLSYNDLIHPDFQEKVWELFQHKLSSGATPELEYPIITSSGETRWVWERAKGVYNKEGDVIFLEGFVTDISQKKLAEQALKESEKKHREILNSINDGYFETDFKGNITFCNEAAASSLGYSVAEFIGKNYREFCNDYKAVFKSFNKVFKTGKTVHAETFQMIKKDGSTAYAEFSLSLMEGKKGSLPGFRGVGRDVTERKRYENQLKYLSLHDQLTGLYNRAYFENELERLSISGDYPVTVISFDLDGLKLINDTVGHEKGDQLLAASARILKKTLRERDILARVGGDEFVALLPGTDSHTGEKIARRIQTMVDKENKENQHPLPLSISLGYATADSGNKSLQQTFKEADDLMYRAKLHKGVDARSQIIQSLMATLGERDHITMGHAHRLKKLCLEIGKTIDLSQKQLSDLSLLAQVHDLGKVGTPDNILFKKGPLTEQEWQIMKQHSEKGYRIALSSVDLSTIANLILKHHEHWDGNGYPLGISGNDIPIECRIMAIADAYDAMTSDRPYRKAMTTEKAIAELKTNAGTQFDPDLVDIFLRIIEQIISFDE